MKVKGQKKRGLENRLEEPIRNNASVLSISKGYNDKFNYNTVRKMPLSKITWLNSVFILHQ